MRRHDRQSFKTSFPPEMSSPSCGKRELRIVLSALRAALTLRQFCSCHREGSSCVAPARRAVAGGGRAGLLEDKLCQNMKMNLAAKALWPMVNGSFGRKLTYAEQWLYSRMESGLAKYALAARAERPQGWPHKNVMSAASVVMATSDVLKMLREVVDQNDNAPLSQAEFNLFAVMEQALALSPDEARTGKSESGRHCRICGALLRDCFCN